MGRTEVGMENEGCLGGGKVACLTPPPSDIYGYHHWDLHLDATCWGDERPRVRYVLHDDWTQTLNTRLFDDMS